MHDLPTPEQIQAALARLQGSADPADAHAAYIARVAANLGAIAQRQQAEDPAVATAEAQRLRALLAGDALPDDDLPRLNQRLADAIASGRIGLHTPGLAGHLWQVALAKLAVDQPGYGGHGAGMAPAPATPAASDHAASPSPAPRRP
ncbi:MAG: DUF6285 domain-containing protein [Aquabacterium sp.]